MLEVGLLLFTVSEILPNGVKLKIIKQTINTLSKNQMFTFFKDVVHSNKIFLNVRTMRIPLLDCYNPIVEWHQSGFVKIFKDWEQKMTS